jgi:hypothetical protein
MFHKVDSIGLLSTDLSPAANDVVVSVATIRVELQAQGCAALEPGLTNCTTLCSPGAGVGAGKPSRQGSGVALLGEDKTPRRAGEDECLEKSHGASTGSKLHPCSRIDIAIP